MNKCYGITVEGKVQDIGFRGLVENIARSNYLAGIVFNDKNESVKMIVRGEVSVIDDFFSEIQTKGIRRGIVLNITDKKELALDIPLPLIFTKVNADDETDIGKKLDKGNDLLFLLVDGQNKLVDGQNKLVDGQNKLVDGQNDIKSVLSSMDETLKIVANKR